MNRAKKIQRLAGRAMITAFMPFAATPVLSQVIGFVSRAAGTTRHQGVRATALCSLVSMVLYAGVAPEAHAEQDRLEAIDGPAPPLVLNNLDGEVVDLAALTNKVVLINFWAVWCSPCRAEMPSLQTLYASLDPDDFEIIAVDMGSPRNQVDAFLADMDPELRFSIVQDASSDVADAWDVRGIPVSFIVDKAGVLTYRAIGERDWNAEAIRENIVTLIDAP